MSDRTFHVTGSSGLTQSYFHGSTPSGSAAKAFNSTCHSKKPCKKLLTVKDMSSGKKHSYVCTRKLTPKQVNLNGTLVNFRFSTKVKAIDSKKVSSVRKTLNKKSSVDKCIKKCRN